MADPTTSGQPPAGTTKEEALEACAELHLTLVQCFKNCSPFGWCCKDEHSAFWDCYVQHRGEEQNVIGKWVSDRLSGSSAGEQQKPG